MLLLLLDLHPLARSRSLSLVALAPPDRQDARLTTRPTRFRLARLVRAWRRAMPLCARAGQAEPGPSLASMTEACDLPATCLRPSWGRRRLLNSRSAACAPFLPSAIPAPSTTPPPSSLLGSLAGPNYDHHHRRPLLVARQSASFLFRWPARRPLPARLCRPPVRLRLCRQRASVVPAASASADSASLLSLACPRLPPPGHRLPPPAPRARLFAFSLDTRALYPPCRARRAPDVPHPTPPWPTSTRAESRLASIRRSRASSCSVVRRSSRRASVQRQRCRFVAKAEEEWRSANERVRAGTLSGRTTEANGVVEHFLRTFIEQVYLPCIAAGASDSAVTVDDVLSSPPRHDLSADPRFWTMLARFSIYRFREPLVDDETRSYVRPALECFEIIKATYSRLTRRPVDLAVVQEAEALIRRGNVSAGRARPVATHDDLTHFVREGVFGSQLLLRCPREQIQMAAFHLLIAYCAVRPSDVVLGRLQSDALCWRDVDFYLTLWVPDEEDGSNDAAARAAEERQVAEEADGQNGPGEIVGERATGARRASPRFRLYCDVTFRNVEGRPADPTTWRTQQLYDSGGAACLEPVLLLAQMADDDGIFERGLSIARALEQADPSFFDNRHFLRVHIKREARDQFVFRAFELVDVGSSDDGAAASSTAGPSTSTSPAAAPAAAVASPSATIAPSPPPPNLRWTVSASEPCTLSMANATTARLANACGLPEFRSDAVLRMIIQTLERTSPSESGFLVVDAQGRRPGRVLSSGRMATVRRILRSLAEPRQTARVGRAQGRSDDAWLEQAATIPVLGRTDLSAAIRSAAAANDDGEDNEDAGPTRRVRRRV